MACVQAFAIVYVAVVIVNSIWAVHTRLMLGVVIGFLFIWAVTNACLAVLITYVNIVYADSPYWHVRTFVTMASQGIVVFVGGVAWTFNTVDVMDAGTGFLIVFIIGVASTILGLVAGGLGVWASKVFIQRIVFFHIRFAD